MNNILEKWESLSASSGIVRFLDINLRSIGQVMFQNNPLTGILFLAAIAWASYAAGVPRVAIAGVLAVVVANLTAQWLNADRESLHAGLYGYNGVLVGLALATFLAPNALMWVYVVLGASVSVSRCLGPSTPLSPGECPASRFRSCSRRGSFCWPRMDFPASQGLHCRLATLSLRFNPTRLAHSS